MSRGAPAPPLRTERAVLWLMVLTVAAAVVDPVVALASTAPYSFADQAISDLGATTCGTVAATGGTVQVCSPWWPLMNAGMVLTGGALAAVGVRIRRLWDVGRGASVALVVAGLSTLGAGVVPLDVSLSWHLVLALPAFPAQAVALALLAGPVARAAGRSWRPVLVVAAVLTGLATALFVAPSSWGLPFGVVERVAAYLLPLLLAAVAIRLLLAPRAHA